MLKKFCLILVLVVCLLPLWGCSSSNREYKTSISAQDVAKLSLFTYDGKSESVFGLPNLGHSFLSIENISEENFKIGNRIVAPNETIALGTWSIQAHFGVWYNVESNYISEYDKYNGRVSITTGINLEDIVVINEYISKNDNWSPLDNCSNFALGLWNGIAEDSEKIEIGLIKTPKKIAIELAKFDSYEINKEIITDTKFNYYSGETPVYFELEKNYENV